MLTNNKLKAFIPTTKPKQAKQFYQDTLGLKLNFETDYSMQFEGKQSLLMITTVESFEPQPFTVLGWNVSDIETEIRSLSKLGVELETYDSLEQDNLGIWTAPSKAKIAWFKDPDGNLLSLTEMPK